MVSESTQTAMRMKMCSQSHRHWVSLVDDKQPYGRTILNIEGFCCGWNDSAVIRALNLLNISSDKALPGTITHGAFLAGMVLILTMEREAYQA
jgi:hypothetical protein